MELMKAIEERRSVRKFTDEAVTEEQITVLLRAAMAAPSAGNAQPWQFVVVDDRNVLEKVPALHPYAGMAAKAPLAILVCGDLSAEKYPGFWVQDCSAAIQNMLLAAVDQGLGAVWTGIYPDETRVKNFVGLVGLPESVKPLALVVVGVPDQKTGAKDRFDAAKVHRNHW
ncbi:nitroreductase family protein [Oleidesulfovibrio sp.]|uniref:nitroreductase family protein n=1 Tax=Oleidesulfovibrio sp. TaxID=2909707 RepID=UPI003A85C1BD